MKSWSVTVPIAGHAFVVFVVVEANDEESAISAALDIATLENVEEWEALKQFNQGNICHFPRPLTSAELDYDDAEEREDEQP